MKWFVGDTPIPLNTQQLIDVNEKLDKTGSRKNQNGLAKQERQEVNQNDTTLKMQI